MNIKELQARYPFVTLTEKGEYVYIKYGNAEGSIKTDDPELENKVYRENFREAAQAYLSAAYPYLHFGLYGGLKCINEGHVWISRIYWYDKERVEAIDGTATGFSFKYPPEDSIHLKLNELNEQAKLAQEDDMFFCTKCQKAKSSDEYGGFFFAEVRCKQCADKAWLKAAREETYD